MSWVAENGAAYTLATAAMMKTARKTVVAQRLPAVPAKRQVTPQINRSNADVIVWWPMRIESGADRRDEFATRLRL
jgi:hypothetical protein